MPSIMLQNQAAGTANILDGLEFQDIPTSGALVTIYASTAVAGGNIDFRVGGESYLVGAQLNIEASADVVDVDRDLVLDQEPVGGGKMFLAVNAQICNVLVQIDYLPG